MNIKLLSRIVGCGIALGTLLPVAATAQTPIWKRQLGTSDYNSSSGVAVDTRGNTYISGVTFGSLAGANQGSIDAWVAKYNNTGKLVWKQQLGTSDYDSSFAVAVDTYGNAYISGTTAASLAGANQGGSDAWVAKYNNSGKLVWKRQLGSSGDDESYGVAVDTYGNVYISGYTTGALAGAKQGGSDAWVAKYNSSGKLVWKQQLGSSEYDTSSGIAVDTYGNVYISGETDGALARALQGYYDAWVAKYNSDGKLIWKQQLGTSNEDVSFGVAVDTIGNLYISGITDGALAGANQGI